MCSLNECGRAWRFVDSRLTKCKDHHPVDQKEYDWVTFIFAYAAVTNSAQWQRAVANMTLEEFRSGEMASEIFSIRVQEHKTSSTGSAMVLLNQQLHQPWLRSAFFHKEQFVVSETVRRRTKYPLWYNLSLSGVVVAASSNKPLSSIVSMLLLTTKDNDNDIEHNQRSVQLTCTLMKAYCTVHHVASILWLMWGGGHNT